MNKPARCVFLILAIILTLHFVLSLTYREYGRTMSGITSYFSPAQSSKETSPTKTHDTVNIIPGDTVSSRHRANATFVMLARDSDVEGAVKSVRAVEDRFNRGFGYPYVFLNDVEFGEEFRRRVSVLTKAKVEFGVIPREHWHQPEWVDEEKATRSRNKMVSANVKYGDSVSYRNMCRFNSGFFFKHELLRKYRWYWRVEPSIQYHCNINHDPFVFMEDNDKVYSFTIAVYEIPATIPTLWSHVKEFMHQHPEFVSPTNAMAFLSHNAGETFNRCHFWSNFEIADMNFWRGPAYTAFFEYLDRTGGFYYERWGDAPIHSIAAALFLRKNQIHFFEEIGYQHDDWGHCPLDDRVWQEGRCSCDQKHSFDYDVSSCKRQWDRIV